MIYSIFLLVRLYGFGWVVGWFVEFGWMDGNELLNNRFELVCIHLIVFFRGYDKNEEM